MEQNKIILYQDDNEITRVAVRFADEDLWLTQNQLAEIYDTTKQNISLHIENILKDGELDPNRTVKDFLTVRQEGNRYDHRSWISRSVSGCCAFPQMGDAEALRVYPEGFCDG